MNSSFFSRRVFMIQALGVAGAGAALSESALAALPVKHLEETDETAVALGYKHDTTKVDSAKFPKHQPSQRCMDCGFFQGAATDEWAGCAMFGRKQIHANGWCNAWVKKPA